MVLAGAVAAVAVVMVVVCVCVMAGIELVGIFWAVGPPHSLTFFIHCVLIMVFPPPSLSRLSPPPYKPNIIITLSKKK